MAARALACCLTFVLVTISIVYMRKSANMLSRGVAPSRILSKSRLFAGHRAHMLTKHLRMSHSSPFRGSGRVSASQLEGLDPTQVELMREECILVDEGDRVVGHASKYETHLMENIEQGKALHRAFSVFLFDSEGRLLLQRRAPEKITFPNAWTNTCCSHPLYREEELESKDHMGVKKAACRKLDHELGISSDLVQPQDLVFLTRILYKAPSDGIWGEHEVDYILFGQKDLPELTTINANEVSEATYVTPAELKEILETEEMGGEKVVLTPWFRLIAESGRLFNWWKELPTILQTKASNDIRETDMIITMR